MIRFASIASLLSAFSALLYQSLWLRSFSLVFGGTRASLSLVLAVFMAGLALGSFLIRRLAIRDTLKAYAVAETGMALMALAVPALLRLLPLQAGGLALLPALACATASGATLPLLMQTLEEAGQPEHPSFGRLYALNCLGAALGALGAVFFLIPFFGVRGASAAAAAINLGLAFWSWKKSQARPPTEIPFQASPVSLPSPSPARTRFVTLSFLSGLSALILEICWTRALSLALGSSAYAFALMIAGSLCGIALGGALYARRQASIQRPALALGRGYAILALLILANAVTLGLLPDLYFAIIRRVAPSFVSFQFIGFALALGILLPVSALQGFLFPLLLRLSGQEGGRKDSAALYLSNTLGAVLGALLGGLWPLPQLGIQAFFSIAAGLSGLGATLAWPGPKVLRGGVAALLLALAGVATAYFRPWNPLLMCSGVFQQGFLMAQQMPADMSLRDMLKRQQSMPFYQEGADSVVGVRVNQSSRETSLVINGKVDASLHGDVLTQTLVGQLPLLLKPDAKNAYVIGWGSGCTVGSVALHPLTRFDCVEIEPQVAMTAEYFRAINSGKGASDPSRERALWEDPRLRLRFADARHDLSSRAERYDVIISEPSNPWISGVANLYTLDFYSLLQPRLKPGGVFCQWFHYYSMDLETLRLQLRTFAAAWPKCSLWIAPGKAGDLGLSGDVILIGSEQEPDLESSSLISRLESPGISQDLTRADCCGSAENLGNPIRRDRWWLYSLRLLGDKDLRAFAGEGPLNTDDRPRLELAAPRALYRSLANQVAGNFNLFRALEQASSELIPPLKGASRPELLLRLGSHYSQRSLFRKAIAALNAAHDAGMRETRLELELGRAYFFDKRPDEAEPHLRRALLASREGYDTFLRQAGAYISMGRADLALSVFEMALRIKPMDPEAHFGRGLCLGRLQRRSEAISALHEALRLRPFFSEAGQALKELE